MPRRWLALTLVFLVVVAPAGSVAAGGHGQGGDGSPDGSPVDGPANESADGSTAGCFTATDHEFVIGETDGANIHLGLHLSLFKDLGSSGAFGVELDGNIRNATIISLQTGVLFEGISSADSFFANPLSAFEMVYEYRFSLPMFADETGNDWTHEETEPPLTGPFETAEC